MLRASTYLIPVLYLTVLAGQKSIADEPVRPIRALLVAGGCCHDYENQKGLLTRGLSRRANIQWTIAHDPDTSTRHKNPIYDRPDWSKDFDVVVHDECSSDVNDMKVIETILQPHKNGLPAVVLHCGMHSYRTEGWNKKVATPWMQFTGLISTGHGPQEPIAVTVRRQGPRDHQRTSATGRPSTRSSTTTPLASSNPRPTHWRAAHRFTPISPDGKEVTETRPWSPGPTSTMARPGSLPPPSATTTQPSNDPRYLDLVARGLLWSLDKLDAEHLKSCRVGRSIAQRHRTPHSHRPNDVFWSSGWPDCLSVQPIWPRWWDS